MICCIAIVRYPRYMGFMGFLSMALFRLPFLFSSKKFYKLLGTSKSGSFDMHPDWNKWGILWTEETYTEQNPLQLLPSFIRNYWKLCNCTTEYFVLQPLMGFGNWDGKECFGNLPANTIHEGIIVVLTRATIRFNQLKTFWKHAPLVSQELKHAKGLIASYGVGEIPFVKQGTISIWENEAAMKAFAYNMKAHRGVISKTRKENWYSEEMFVRFKLIQSSSLTDNR